MCAELGLLTRGGDGLVCPGGGARVECVPRAMPRFGRPVAVPRAGGLNPCRVWGVLVDVPRAGRLNPCRVWGVLVDVPRGWAIEPFQGLGCIG